MAAPVDVNVSNLYSDLQKFSQNNDWDKALKTARKIGQLKQNDQKIAHCKVVCYMQQNRFHDALNDINRDKNLSGLIFEKAYCQYRLNLLADALETLDSAEEMDYRIIELKAQVFYRLERYEECYELYRSLIKNSDDDYEDERETNLAAVIVNLNLNRSQLANEVPKIDDRTYELCYNNCCNLLAQDKPVEAEAYAVKAEDLCKKTLEDDDLGDEEIEAELGIIRAQLGYSLQLQAKAAAASELFAKILKHRSADIALTAVISNNIVALNKDQNVFDSKKKIKAATAEGLEHKLTSHQRQSIAFNQCLLSFYTNQGELCKQQADQLTESRSAVSEEAVLVLSAQYAREKNLVKAVETLQEYQGSNTDTSTNVVLALAQLLLMQGRVNQVCDVLKTLNPGLRYRPGIISTLVTLYSSMEDKEAASSVLKNAIDWYKQNDKSNPFVSSLYRESSSFHLRSGLPAVAAQSLEELRRLNPKDTKTLAQLIRAYSQFDSAKAVLLSQQLPPTAEFSKDVDVDSLESANWALGVKYAKKTGKPEAAAPTKPGTSTETDLIQKKKPKKKKVRLPKKCDPNVAPDPERWLPKHERTAFKKRRDKKKDKDSGIGKGTQGGVSTSAADALDISKAPVTSKSAASTSQGGPSGGGAQTEAGPRQQRMQQAHKKKKKKGGR